MKRRINRGVTFLAQFDLEISLYSHTFSTGPAPSESSHAKNEKGTKIKMRPRNVSATEIEKLNPRNAASGPKAIIKTYFKNIKQKRFTDVLNFKAAPSISVIFIFAMKWPKVPPHFVSGIDN